MLPRKIFENLHSIMASLVLSEQFLRQIFFKLLASDSKSFTKYNAFCLQILISACLRQ